MSDPLAPRRPTPQPGTAPTGLAPNTVARYVTVWSMRTHAPPRVTADREGKMGLGEGGRGERGGGFVSNGKRVAP